MTDLSPLTALGGGAPQVARVGALTLSETADLALASLALRRGGTTPAPFGLTLPGPGGWAQSGPVSALWTGPGQWLLEAPGAAETDFAAALADDCPGTSVTDQTDGFAVFEIVSRNGAAPVEALLSKLFNIDLSSFGPGRATRTGFEHMSVFVIRRAADRVAILGMRSAAGSIWHTLTTAAARVEIQPA